ncbi:MAG TPA: hypothetical protein VF121_18800 [Thermoanaerobaculia bacterium]|nr:hypothetical protein [Thermoanaerobaculia bacterium]
MPTTAKALSLNVTVTQPGAGGHLTLHPAGQALPGTSTLNFGPGQTRANNAVLPLAADGSGGLAAHLASTAPAHLLLDVTGWFE